jgi:CHRD domain
MTKLGFRRATQKSSTILRSAQIAGLSALMMVTVLPLQPAQAIVYHFAATLDGATESPPNASTATGTVSVQVDDVAKTLQLSTTFTGLIGGPAAAAHIHCCTVPPNNVGVAIGMTGFPAVSTGSFSATFALDSSATYAASFVAANGGAVNSAYAALLAGLNSGQAYFNIHNATYPGGEIRGFFAAVTPIPVPGALPLLATALAALGIGIRRCRQKNFP